VKRHSAFCTLATISVCLLSATFSQAATTIHVPADQPTIQSGINAASNGDTVLVAPGTYKENINFSGKAITLKSSGGARVTIIDGEELLLY
jgi:polygalacturonase